MSFNDTTKQCFHFSQWSRLETLSTDIYSLMMLMNSLTILPAVILNFFICFTIYKTPSLNAVPSMIIIANMALSDFTVGLVAQPIFIAWNTMEYIRRRNYQCGISIAFGISSTLFAGVSLLTITISSVDRYLALRIHLRYTAVITSKVAFLACLGVWMFALVISFSWILLDFLIFTYFLVASMSICMTATLFFYGVIFKTLRRHQRQIMAQEASQSETNTTNTSTSLQRYRKCLMNTFLVYAVFLICYLPLFIFLVLYTVEGGSRLTVIGINLTTNVVFMNSAINPVLFLWRVCDLRQACKVTLSKFFSMS